MCGDDDRIVLNEREKPELLLAVLRFDFLNMLCNFFEKLLGHDGVGIFVKESHSDHCGLRPVFIKIVMPYANRLGAVGCLVELDGAKLVTRFQFDCYLIC
jgi:hypothetical protein